MVVRQDSAQQHHTFILEDINTSLSMQARNTSQRLNKKVKELTEVMSQLSSQTSIEHSIKTHKNITSLFHIYVRDSDAFTKGVVETMKDFPQVR